MELGLQGRILEKYCEPPFLVVKKTAASFKVPEKTQSIKFFKNFSAPMCYLCDPRDPIFHAKCATMAQRRQLFEKFYVNYCELCGSKKDTKYKVF